MAALTQAVDIGMALEGLPVAAAVAVAVLWTKVHRLERDHRAEVKERREMSRVIGRFEVTVGKLETTLDGLRDVVGKVVRVDIASHGILK